MATSQLTIDCRAAADRMANFSRISGNTQMLQQLVYEDSAAIEQLRLSIQDEPTVPAGMVQSLVVAHSQTSNAMECEGNLQLHPLAIGAAADVVAACDFADTLPQLVGTIQGITKAVDPRVTMTSTPLDARLQAPGAMVLIKGTTWPSINDQSWPIVVVSVPNAQFTLTGADTTAELGSAAGGTVSVE